RRRSKATRLRGGGSTGPAPGTGSVDWLMASLPVAPPVPAGGAESVAPGGRAPAPGPPPGSDGLHSELAPLDLAGAQALQGQLRLAARDGDVAAGGEDVDLADRVLVQPGIAGQRADDVARAQLVDAAGIDAQGRHRSEERRVGKGGRCRWW